MSQTNHHHHHRHHHHHHHRDEQRHHSDESYPAPPLRPPSIADIDTAWISRNTPSLRYPSEDVASSENGVELPVHNADRIPSSSPAPPPQELSPLYQLVINAFKAEGIEHESKEENASKASKLSDPKFTKISWLPKDYICRAVRDGKAHSTVEVIRLRKLVHHFQSRNFYGLFVDIQAAPTSSTDTEFCIAVAMESKKVVTVWDKKLKFGKELYGHDFPVKAAAWSCSGILATVASADEKRTESVDNQVESAASNDKSLQAMISRLLKSVISFDKNSSSYDRDSIGQLIVWDLKYLQPRLNVALPRRNNEHVESLCWSPCGRYLACGALNVIFILDAATGKQVSEDDDLETNDYPRTLKWVKYGSDEFLASGSTTGSNDKVAVLVWRLTEDGAIRINASECSTGLPYDKKSVCTCLSWATGLELLATVISNKDSTKLGDFHDQTVHLWRQRGTMWSSIKIIRLKQAPALWIAFKQESTHDDKSIAIAVSTSNGVFRFRLKDI